MNMYESPPKVRKPRKETYTQTNTRAHTQTNTRAHTQTYTRALTLKHAHVHK